MLNQKTIERALSQTTRWQTAGQVTDHLRQCGPSAFISEEEYKDFHYTTKAKQYSSVYNALMRLREVCVDSCLGADDGREVRVFKLLCLA